MKKLYIQPQTEVVKVEIQTLMEASASASIYNDDATGLGLSRGGGSWDEDEEDY